MSDYTIKIDGAAAVDVDTLGVTSISIELRNQAPDVLTIIQEGKLIDSAASIAYDVTVELIQDTTTIFYGICRSVPRQGLAAGESVRSTILGPWHWLEHIPYTQSHYVWYSGALTNRNKTRVILNQSSTGLARWDSGEQIADAITVAIVGGAPVLAGTIDPDTEIPYSERVDITCAEVIRNQLEWTPDAAVYFDYTTTDGGNPKPTLHVRRVGSLTPGSVALTASTLTSSGITARYDLQCKGIRIIFEKTHTDGTDTWHSVEEDTAGTPDALGGLTSTVSLAGLNLTRQAARVETSDVPVDWTDDDFWQERVPSLAAFAAADLTVHNVTFDIDTDDEELEIGDLPRILDKGPIPDWVDAETAFVTINAQYDAIERDAANAIVSSVKNVKISLTLTLTDATTQTYTKTDGDYAEPTPVGLAAALYASHNRLQFDGSVQLTENEPTGAWFPGRPLNITGGLAEWATMAAQVQTVTIDISSGTTSLTFGPAKHIGLDKLLQLLRVTRRRADSWHHKSRHSGDAQDGAVGMGGHAARHEHDAHGGEPKRSVYKRDSGGSYTAAIDIDPDAVTKTTESDSTAIEIEPRELVLLERDGTDDSEGVLVRRQVMASVGYDAPTSAEFAIVPRPSGSSPGVLTYDPADGGSMVWVYSTTLYKVFQHMTGNVLGFDWERGHA